MKTFQQRTPASVAMLAKRTVSVALLAFASLLGACATPASLPPGSSRDQVVAAFGPPTAIYQLPQPTPDSPYLRVDPSGRATSRLEYRGGSFSTMKYMFDFDSGDRLLASAQVHTEARFNAILAGMDRQQVLRALGVPSTVWRLGFQSQDVWAYRFENPFCQWFQVGVGDNGRVVDTAYGPDPICDSLFDNTNR